MSRRGPKMPPPRLVKPPRELTADEQKQALSQILRLFEAAGIDVSQVEGKLVGAVAAVINERHQLRMQLAFVNSTQKPEAAPVQAPEKVAPPK